MIEEQPQVKEIKLFDSQYNAYWFETQFGAAVAGVQSGKTFLGAHWAGRKICEFPKGVGIIIAPTYKILQHATMKKFFDVFPLYRKYYKEQKGEIHLPTGAIIYIRSADAPLGIEGITANWWWLDEGGQCSVMAWTVLRSRVSMTGGQGLITTTPYNMGWLYQEFYLPWKEGRDKNLSFFSWRSVDNPAYPKEFYESERQRLKPEEFARRYMGEFKKMTGLVFDFPDDRVIDPKDIMVKSEARIMGVDWGYENPAAIVILYLYDKTWYVVDEWKQTHRTTTEIIQVMKNKYVEHHINYIYPDPAEPDRIQECRLANLSPAEANKDVLGGISRVQQLINTKRIFIFNNCKEFILEASMYHYPEDKDDKKKDIPDLPVKINDHLMDAMRYAIHSYSPIMAQEIRATAPAQPYYPELGF